MPAKTWDEDFRNEAIEASVRKLGEVYLDDPFSYDGSFCLTVGERPRQGWTPFWIRGCVYLTSFVLEVSIMVYIISCFVVGIDVAFRVIFLIPSVMLASIGIEQLLVSRTGECFILRRLMKDRVQTRLEEFDAEHMIPCELIDPNDERHYYGSDDYVLIFLDEERRRLLIEGVSARYQIRADDVTGLEKYEWTGWSSVFYRSGALLTCRIDETTELTLAAVREPSDYEERQQMLLWLCLSRARRNALKKNALIGPFKQTLQFSDATGRAKEEIEVEQSSI